MQSRSKSFIRVCSSEEGRCLKKQKNYSICMRQMHYINLLTKSLSMLYVDGRLSYKMQNKLFPSFSRIKAVLSRSMKFRL